jgi:hypothetical protein
MYIPNIIIPYLTNCERAGAGVFFVSEGNPAVRSNSYLTTGKKRIDFHILRNLSGIQAVEVRTRRKEMGTVLSSELLGPLEQAV